MTIESLCYAQGCQRLPEQLKQKWDRGQSGYLRRGQAYQAFSSVQIIDSSLVNSAQPCEAVKNRLDSTSIKSLASSLQRSATCLSPRSGRLRSWRLRFDNRDFRAYSSAIRNRQVKYYFRGWPPLLLSIPISGWSQIARQLISSCRAAAELYCQPRSSIQTTRS